MPGVDVDTARRLVEEEDLGLAQQRSGQEHPLLLATREFADVAAGEFGDTEALKDGGHRSALLRRRPWPDSVLGARHEDALEDRDGELPVDGLKLRHVGDAQTRGGGAGAAAGLDEPEQHPQECGLAGPGRPDDARE